MNPGPGCQKPRARFREVTDMPAKSYTSKRILMGRIPEGEDLQSYMNKWVKEQGIVTGTINIIGSVRSLAFSWFNHDTGSYEDVRKTGDFEIGWCGGTISKREDDVVVHLHLIVHDATGKSFGGHVIPGNPVFVAEYWVHEFDGEPMERVLDRKSGLWVWPV
jgi:predicted DNA-binding protein with PD1-like motif